ncbi:hypothetical protein Celaphus_00008111 [Cervus elaphus hippelaphus]|uniref:Uncharacterized protein n=1 Tax=Cervus elaphus hippelaphus TaxID=46360 RepID=A0A212CPY4_CEREH|nr:hypothetical protein Celaphus_00008111 [Cervus elaphus hippelaphus]
MEREGNGMGHWAEDSKEPVLGHRGRLNSPAIWCSEDTASSGGKSQWQRECGSPPKAVSRSGPCFKSGTEALGTCISELLLFALCGFIQTITSVVIFISYFCILLTVLSIKSSDHTASAPPHAEAQSPQGTAFAQRTTFGNVQSDKAQGSPDIPPARTARARTAHGDLRGH